MRGIEVVVAGETFPSVTKAAEHYGMPLKTVQTRLSRDWNIEQALGLKSPPRHFRSAYNAWLAAHNLRMCSKCNQERTLDDYYPRTNGHGEWSSQCKQCIKEQVRDSMRLRKFGLSAEAWQKLFESQNHSCKICGTKEPGTNTHHWHTDHCHQTNRVRGILCRDCNLLLGFAKDNPQILKEAIVYLNEYIDPEEAA